MRAFVFAMLIALAGCAPAAENAPSAAAPSVPERLQSPPVAAPAPAPAPAAELPSPSAAQKPPKELLVQGGVDYACRIPADCAVKDVGNCCGAYPQCVNKDSPTFPEKVKAACTASGMSSVCGFEDIASCDCIEGRCTGVNGNGASTPLQ